MRAARETVKVERAGGLMRFIGDVSRVESKAGTQAALDGLKLARSPGEMSRVAKLAEKEGSKTRAILMLLGRDAIALAAAVIDLAMWIFGALLSALSFVAALKGMTERITAHVLRHRKAVRRRASSPPWPTKAATAICPAFRTASDSAIARRSETARPSAFRQRIEAMPSFRHGEVEIAYLDEGEGEPIVLIHGFASITGSTGCFRNGSRR